MSSPQPERYGPGPRQVGHWWVPSGEEASPTVVLVHGGFWRAGYDLHLQDAVAADLTGRGYLCWNVDYAPSDAPWPATLLDVAAALDHVREGRFAARVDPGRVAVVGHSAGGHLALWLAGRRRLPAGAPGARRDPVIPALAVGQAPVADLAGAVRDGLGNHAAADLLGTRDPVLLRERLAVADPMALLPSGVPTVLLHGTGDEIVPVGQSRAYVDAARAAGDNCTLVELPGGHYTHLDPQPGCSTGAAQALRTALATMGPRGRQPGTSTSTST